MALEEKLSDLRRQLLAARTPAGHWVGELSSSALSTGTAICALAWVDRSAYDSLIRGGLSWLVQNQNVDGGWGDTVVSASNLSTTVLCWGAFGVAGELAGPYQQSLARTESWLRQRVGGLAPEALAKAILQRYGKDRTFSAPILTQCALTGRLGEGKKAWRWVSPLPFELAALPQRWYKRLRLPVVSYALPALIAIGLVQHHHRPTLNPVGRLLRNLAQRRTLKILAGIQPAGGGFLEAIPLTSFVVMGLERSGYGNHTVVSRSVEFLTRSVRPDGSWPIDTNLSTWLTTLSVNALAINPGFSQILTAEERGQILEWLLGQQYSEEHPYTLADPGGWAWTDLPGGVPDADDTSGALLAMRNLALADGRVLQAVRMGVSWILGLQNQDGGLPTFCKGWGTLPFDQSSPDITSHSLLALFAWLDDLPSQLRLRTEMYIKRAVAYLRKVQGKDGSWTPLWFGNEFSPGEANPTYGTARVVRTLQVVGQSSIVDVSEMMMRGIDWLLSAQNSDGSWGGAPKEPSSIEETALAVETLAAVSESRTVPPASQHVSVWAKMPSIDSEKVKKAVLAGTLWLVTRPDAEEMKPSPIGLYFAKLWYFERLYPLIFTVAALEKVRTTCPAFEKMNADAGLRDS